VADTFDDPTRAKTVLARNQKGENLVYVWNHPLLGMMAKTTVWRLINEGRLPAVRIGKGYHTTESLIQEALVTQSRPGRKKRSSLHQIAEENINRRLGTSRRAKSTESQIGAPCQPDRIPGQ